MLPPAIRKNDSRAKFLIIAVSAIVFIAVVSLKYIHLDLDLGFDVHIFAKINAFINGAVAITLLSALIVIRRHNYLLHKRLMLVSILLSAIFLISYIAHHALAGNTIYPKDAPLRVFYFFVLSTHIFL